MSREVMSECLEEAAKHFGWTWKAFLCNAIETPQWFYLQPIATIACALYRERCRQNVSVVSIPSVWEPSTISPSGETTWTFSPIVQDADDMGVPVESLPLLPLSKASIRRVWKAGRELAGDPEKFDAFLKALQGDEGPPGVGIS